RGVRAGGHRGLVSEPRVPALSRATCRQRYLRTHASVDCTILWLPANFLGIIGRGFGSFTTMAQAETRFHLFRKENRMTRHLGFLMTALVGFVFAGCGNDSAAKIDEAAKKGKMEMEKNQAAVEAKMREATEKMKEAGSSTVDAAKSAAEAAKAGT